MMNLAKSFLLVLLFALSGCMETVSAAPGGTYGNRRGPWRRTPAALGTVSSNIFDKFTWDVSYEAPGATGLVWIPASGAPILNTSGVPTINQSTSPLTNLPARLVNVAMRAGSDFYSGNLNWTSDNFHYRGVFDLDNTPTLGDRVFRYEPGPTQFAQIRVISATEVRFVIQDAASGGTYTGTFTGAGIPTGFLLVDWVVNGAQMNVYINGVDYSPAANAGGVVNFSAGSASFTFLGPTVEGGVHVFHGWRFGHILSLEDHQADATEIGL